jgi:hypothetical protein
MTRRAHGLSRVAPGPSLKRSNRESRGGLPSTRPDPKLAHRTAGRRQANFLYSYRTPSQWQKNVDLMNSELFRLFAVVQPQPVP